MIGRNFTKQTSHPLPYPCLGPSFPSLVVDISPGPITQFIHYVPDDLFKTLPTTGLY